MGYPEAIRDLFQLVLLHYKQMIARFDDQAAITEHYGKFSQNISLDRNWYVFGTLQFMKPAVDHGLRLPRYELPRDHFSCLGVDESSGSYMNIARNCYQVKYSLKEVFKLNTTSCTASISPKTEGGAGSLSEGLVPQLHGLHLSPPVLHGNGKWTKSNLQSLQKWGDECIST